MSYELTFDAPFPSRPEVAVQHDSIEQAIGELACGRLVIVHNAAVYAILGNANNPSVLDAISDLKDDEGRKTLGWATPLERSLQLVEPAAVADNNIRELISSADLLTRRFGGLGFIRMPAKQEALDARAGSMNTDQGMLTIPTGIIDTEQRTVQPYSPTGSDFMSRLVRTAQAQGIEPVLSSANVHGHKEIVSTEDAQDFAHRASRPLLVLEDGFPVAEDTKPLGSFPIVGVTDEGLQIFRAGCFSPELVVRCFEGYDIQMAPADVFAETKYPDNVYGLEDLPEKYQNLSGAELRLGVLAALGWQANAAELLDANLRSAHRSLRSL